MKKTRFMVAVDCEGVACAVGKPGGTLNDSDNYAFVQQQASARSGCRARALFNAGATQVIVCDYHHSGINWTICSWTSAVISAAGSGHRSACQR